MRTRTAMKLAALLGPAAAEVKQLLETFHKNDGDISELFFLRKFAMQHPAALKDPPPLLYHANESYGIELLYNREVFIEGNEDVPYRPGVWKAPAECIVAGVAILDLKEPEPRRSLPPMPCAILVAKKGTSATITLLCPDAPLAALEHQLLDERDKLTLYQERVFKGSILNEEYTDRKRRIKEELASDGLDGFPDFLVGGTYHIHRKEVHPLLRLRLAETVEEVELLKGLRSRMHCDLKQESRALLHCAEQEELKCSFEIVLQAGVGQSTGRAEDGRPFELAPVLAPLVQLLLAPPASATADPNFADPGERHNLKSHIRKLVEEETAANQTAATTLPTSVPRKFELRDPSSLERMTRRETIVEQYGSGERLHGVVDDLFSPAEAERLHRELDRDADKGSCDSDLQILSKQLHPQALLLFTRVGADGLVASTTLCGHKHFGKQIGLDALARLCMLPWTAHVVNANGALSLQYAKDTDKPVLWTRFAESALAAGGASNGHVSAALQLADVEGLVSKIEALQRSVNAGVGQILESVATKRKHEETGGGGANGSAKHDEHMQRVIAKMEAMAESKCSAVEGCAKSAIAHITEKARAAAGAAACTAAAGAVAAQRLPPSPPPATMPSGIAALDEAIERLRTVDVRLYERLDELVAA